jgi:hypothetical protein
MVYDVLYVKLIRLSKFKPFYIRHFAYPVKKVIEKDRCFKYIGAVFVNLLQAGRRLSAVTRQRVGQKPHGTCV